MALNGHREADNKHWFTCAKIPVDSPSGSSKAFGICCTGGDFNPETREEKTELMSHIFEHYYGPFLTSKFSKVCVLLIYAGYLGASIYGCFNLFMFSFVVPTFIIFYIST